jgi:hypothetical protein
MNQLNALSNRVEYYGQRDRDYCIGIISSTAASSPECDFDLLIVAPVALRRDIRARQNELENSAIKEAP